MQCLFPHAWEQIRRTSASLPSPLARPTWQTNSPCVKTPNCEGLLREQFTLANPVVWLYEQWLVSYTHADMHAHTNLTPEESCKTPRAVKVKRGWRNTSLFSLCLSKRWPYMTRAIRLCMFPTRGWHISCLKVLKTCLCLLRMCAAWMYRSILHLSLFHRNAAAWTHPATHVLTSEKWSASVLEQGQREMDPWEDKKEGGRRNRETDMRGGWGVRCERK